MYFVCFFPRYFTYFYHNVNGIFISISGYSLLCEMKISPTILINRKCHSHQLFLASECQWVLPKLQSSRCCLPHSDCWGARGMQEARWTRKQDVAPDSWSAYEGNEFSEPRGLHLPIHRILNSLTWYLVFDVQTACSLCCKLVYSLTSPHLLEAVFPELLRCCLPGSES